MITSSRGKRKTGIKDMPLSSRPREKLIAKGPENLTNAELLAILLRTGTKNQNAVMTAQKILRYIPLNKLQTSSISKLIKTPGVGKAKAIELLATIEIGKRIFAKSITKTEINSLDDILAQIKDIINKKQEYLIVLYLNARHELLLKETVGIGSLNAAIIEPKEILYHALIQPCAEIIIIHNHPSGDPSPSDDDIHFTKRIHEAGKIMGINLLDHLIVATSGLFSFREGELVFK